MHRSFPRAAHAPDAITVRASCDAAVRPARVCFALMLGLCVLFASRAQAHDWICDSSVDDCRTPLLDLIRHESIAIDAAFWLMTDTRYADEIARRWAAGVPVRIVTDARSKGASAEALQRLRDAGVPIRERTSGATVEWNVMLLAGQRTVQFGGGRYTGEAFAPHASSPGTAIVFTDDPLVVDSFMVQYDDLWTSTDGFDDEPAVPPLLRRYPSFATDPDLHVGDREGFLRRLVALYNDESLGIDAIVSRVTDARSVDALIAAHARGVSVRIVVASQPYRDAADPWHAWSVDRLQAAGVDVRVVARSGVVDGSLVLLRGRGTTVLASAAWTADAGSPRLEHNYFTGKSGVYSRAVAHFERRWHNGAGVIETVPFVPLPPDEPVLHGPGSDAPREPAAVLRWHGGPWAHRYDLYFGPSPGTLPLVGADVELGPNLHPDDSIAWPISGIAAWTSYYWRVVSRTMAGMEQAGPLWSFHTDDAGDVIVEPVAGWLPEVSGTPDVPGGTVVAGGAVQAGQARRSRRPPGDAGPATRVAREAPRDRGEVSCVGCGHPPAALPPLAGPAASPDFLPGWGDGREILVNPDGTMACDSAGCGPAAGGDAGSTPAAGVHVDGDLEPGYPGREPGASWRAEALERIERIRKSDVALRVVDAEGDPVEGASIALRMIRHRFAFGSAVTASDLTADTADAQRYRAIVERSFNRVVLENDLKWRNWIATGSTFYSRDNTYRALDWLRHRGIEVRGHYVTWGKLEGDRRVEQYPLLGAEAFHASLLHDGQEIVTAVGDRVSEWDVVNHPNGRDEGTLLDLLGPEFYDDVFRGVAEWRPDIRRFINEGDVLPATRINRDRYYDLIEQMLVRGAPVQGIGIMGHFFSDDELVSPEELLQVFDRYATFGLPIQVTEFDYWTPNEALQGDFTRDFLIAAFSHRAVEGVVMWGFWEGRHWHPPAALYRQDWSVKPNGRAWEQLVLHDWWTNTTGVTGEDGVYTVRGFHGSYEVEVRHDDRTVTCTFDLGPDGFTGEVLLDTGTCRAAGATPD